jgi:hypothetical protein
MGEHWTLTVLRGVLDARNIPVYRLFNTGEPTGRSASRNAKAESASKGFGADPLNLLQVMLAKGTSPGSPPIAGRHFVTAR